MQTLTALVQSIGAVAMTTSLVVAEKFGKRHKDVLRAIGNLDCSPDFTGRNFAPSEYTDPTGRRLPMFYITRDGFAFLAMGFTGPEAARWKEAFIAAFNALEARSVLPQVKRLAHLLAQANALPPTERAMMQGMASGILAILDIGLNQLDTAIAAGGVFQPVLRRSRRRISRKAA